jgi:flagellar assembly protein FliH
VSSLNRVIHGAPAATAPPAFGAAGPQFVDEWVTELLEEARAEGFAAGRREGFAAGREDMAGAADRIESAIGRAVTDLKRHREEAAAELVEAALAVAEFVLGHAPHDGGEAIAARIPQALADLDDEGLVIAVHPGDWDAVSAAVQLPAAATLTRDPSLRPGEARIAGRWATAELTRNAALAIAREVMS